MRRVLFALAAVPLVSGCIATPVVSPAHVTLSGPTASVQSFASKMSDCDPSLKIKVTRITEDTSTADFAVLKSGDLDVGPAMNKLGRGTTFTYNSGYAETIYNVIF